MNPIIICCENRMFSLNNALTPYNGDVIPEKIIAKKKFPFLIFQFISQFHIMGSVPQHLTKSQ